MNVSKKYLIWTIIVCALALAVNVFIIVHSCLTGPQSSEASGGVVDFLVRIINGIKPGTITDANYGSFAGFVRKAIGHLGLFMVSGLLSTLALHLVLNMFKWAKYYLQIIMALAFGLTIAIITEIIQLNVPGRSGELRDVLIDYSGYILGFSIIFLILFLIIKSKNKKSAKPNN